MSLPQRKTTRLPGYDYRRNAWYYVTICTKDRHNFFGSINNVNLDPTPIGNIVSEYWKGIPMHVPFVKLDQFIIMPNHIHGILIIDKNDQIQTDVACNVPTANQNIMSSISPKPKSLSTIIRSYKSACTKRINELLPDSGFGWQSSFYEHIIRDDEDLSRIQEYIINNPKNWKNDDLYENQ